MEINLEEIDLVRTKCPPETQIEIEGFGKMAVSGPCENGLLSAVATVYVVLTGKAVYEDANFLRRITLLELDCKNKFVKVRVASV